METETMSLIDNDLLYTGVPRQWFVIYRCSFKTGFIVFSLINFRQRRKDEKIAIYRQWFVIYKCPFKTGFWQYFLDIISGKEEKEG